MDLVTCCLDVGGLIFLDLFLKGKEEKTFRKVFDRVFFGKFHAQQLFFFFRAIHLVKSRDFFLTIFQWLNKGL